MLLTLNAQSPHYNNEGFVNESLKIFFQPSLIHAIGINNNETDDLENCVNNTHDDKYWFPRMSSNGTSGHWRIYLLTRHPRIEL